MRQNSRATTILVLALLLAVGIGAGIYLIRINRTNNQESRTSQAFFTVVMSQTGFNGSANKAGFWPIINATRGQTITIRVVNNDPVETHGFAIAHYFGGGVALRPHEFYDVTFVANQAGAFQIYCNIFCAIHPLMQNGRLEVNS